MNILKNCPICKKGIVSGGVSKEYCALCSMLVEGKNIIVKKFGEISKYFCCKLCYQKYKNFREGKLAAY